MELRHYFAIARRWAWLVVLTTGLAAGISYTVSTRLPRLYSSTTTLMVGQVLQAQSPNATELATTEQLAQTYALFVGRQPLLEATAQALGINTPWQALAGQVSANAIPQSQLLQITAVDASPVAAQALANEIAHQLILQSPTPSEKEQDQQQAFIAQQMQLLQQRITDADNQMTSLQNQLTLETSARSVQDVQAQISALQTKSATWQSTYATLLNQKVGRINSLNVIEPASLVPTPISPNTTLNVAVGSAIGLTLAVMAILILEYVDDTLKNSEDVGRNLGLLYLGGIGRIQRAGKPQGAVVMLQEARSSMAEAYRVVRANLEFAMQCTSARSVVVTSASVGEGKTTTACNLAVSLAQAGSRVILCDADLRRPAIRQALGVRRRYGLSTLLSDETLTPDEAIAETGVDGLWVLPSGPTPPNPAEMLGSTAMRERIDELKQLADIVLIDAPALLPLADAGLVARWCDAVIMVVDSAGTRRTTAQAAKERLEQLGVNILGVVLNRTRAQEGSDAGYYLDAQGTPSTRQRRSFLGRILGRAPSSVA